MGILEHIGFRWLSDEEKTYDKCRTAVRAHWLLLEHVPMKFRTEALCKIALDQCNGALLYIPEIVKTEKFYIKAVKEHKISFLCDIPRTMYFRYSKFIRECWIVASVNMELCPYDFKINYNARWTRLILFIKN